MSLRDEFDHFAAEFRNEYGTAGTYLHHLVDEVERVLGDLKPAETALEPEVAAITDEVEHVADEVVAPKPKAAPKPKV
jgi:hypothetical protein